VPATITWPGRIEGGQLRDQIAHATDWLPTLAELANIPLHPGMDLDGESLVPLIHDATATTPHEVLHWLVSDQWAVRSGEFKLIVNPRDTDRSRLADADERDKFFLVNLAEDVGEQTNIRGREPEQMKTLRALHNEALAVFQKQE